MSIALQFLAGLVFGLGLAISGMMDPAKVLNFLDIAGDWDPSLAFVMAGAVIVTAIGYRLVLARRAPFLAASFHLPAAREIDARILVGPAIFGIGWGLAGLCPGPAVASLGLGNPAILTFVGAMLAGMALARLLARHRASMVAASAAHPAATRRAR